MYSFYSQLTLFATKKFYFTNFIDENTQTFIKLFVSNPVESFNSLDPLPSPVTYLYTKEDLLDQINFTASAVSLFQLGTNFSVAIYIL